MKKALILGINDYPTAPLSGCINDANKIFEVLDRNQDDSPNFDCLKLISSEIEVTRSILRDKINKLFLDEVDLALFYFSGHGLINELGGYLVTEDAKLYDEGVSMQDVLIEANKSKAHEVVIILDCCHSGAFGKDPMNNSGQAMLREGISILTASRDSQVSVESNGTGIFTSLIYDALKGGAADILGNVNIPNVYAYADQILGPWDQRPTFKSNLSKLTSLRKCYPEINLSILRLLTEYFPTPTYEFPLDPSYEPTVEPKNPKHEEIFGNLQKYRATRLLIPIGEEHMYFAAMNNKSCKLTALGQFYWNLIKRGRI